MRRSTARSRARDRPSSAAARRVAREQREELHRDRGAEGGHVLDHALVGDRAGGHPVEVLQPLLDGGGAVARQRRVRGGEPQPVAQRAASAAGRRRADPRARRTRRAPPRWPRPRRDTQARGRRWLRRPPASARRRGFTAGRRDRSGATRSPSPAARARRAARERPWEQESSDAPRVSRSAGPGRGPASLRARAARRQRAQPGGVTAFTRRPATGMPSASSSSQQALGLEPREGGRPRDGDESRALRIAQQRFQAAQLLRHRPPAPGRARPGPRPRGT